MSVVADHLADRQRIEKIFNVLVERELAGETGLLFKVFDTVTKIMLRKNFSPKEMANIISGFCSTVLNTKDTIFILNKILANIADKQKTHVATMATTGEFKEQTHKDVQTLIRQYAKKPTKTVNVPPEQKLYAYLVKNPSIYKVSYEKNVCNFTIIRDDNNNRENLTPFEKMLLESQIMNNGISISISFAKHGSYIDVYSKNQNLRESVCGEISNIWSNNANIENENNRYYLTAPAGIDMLTYVKKLIPRLVKTIVRVIGAYASPVESEHSSSSDDSQ